MTKLVVHAMAEFVIGDDGVVRHCTDHLRTCELSVHAFCLPDGRIVEAVPAELVAFHAGMFNGESVGIEVLVAGAHDLGGLVARMHDRRDPPYTATQYESTGAWLRRQAEDLGLGFSAVFTHAELDPQRKEDPGTAFDLRALREAFYAAGPEVVPRPLA